ncbi:MAG: UDP-3-O-(3-hydroxymyristoyl)glucosamine N-acyltransferase [Gemmatimonadaceae bacterium]
MSDSQAARTTPGGEGPRLLTAEAIARLVGGELRGDGKVAIRSVAPLDRAESGDLTFLAAPRYAPLFGRTRAGAALVSPDLAEERGDVAARIIVAKPHEAMLRVLPELYRPPPRLVGVHPSAVIGRGARIGREVAIGPHAVVGRGVVLGDRVTVESGCVVDDGAGVGDDSRLFANVTVYPGAVIGRRVLIHAGARIGSDGFGYVFHDGAHQKVPHVGRCIIGDDVEIGANTTIDRGSIDDTVIGSGTKIDNLVHVGHNVRIGSLCLIMAQVGIAGSTHVEDGAILAGQVGLSGHLTVGKGARLGAQAGVFGDVPAGETWSGYPARPHKEALRAHAALFRLTGIMKTLERLAERERR